MKDATPSDKRKSLAKEKINSLETEKIAEKYRKLGGLRGHDFDYLVDEDDWTPASLRNEIVKEIIAKKNTFNNFRSALTRKYPEYKYLILREDWTHIIGELFLFGGIQPDTDIPFGNVSWFENNTQEKALYIKILPGADRQQVIDFLGTSANKIEDRFRKMNIIIPKVKARTGKQESYELNLWVRVLDSFTSEDIRSAFAMRFPEKYKEDFTSGGKRNMLARAKYQLIAHYLFHRFGLSNKGKPYTDNYIKAIVEKAKKDNAQIKTGLIRKIP